MITMIHLAAGKSQLPADGPLATELRKLGRLVIVEQGRALSDDAALARLREADVVLTMWGSRPIPAALAADPGRVRYILNLTGTCRAFVPIEIIRSGIPVTNWGDAPARPVAEGAMALLLAVLKDLRGRTEAVVAGKCWGAKRLGLVSGTLRGLRLGLYGCGAIGRRFVQLVTPFEPELLVFDPYAPSVPENCRRVATLDALFEQSEAVAIWAGLTDETRGSVTAARLAKLPDHGIIINAARGEIIDQEALFAELKSGRLRAGLDVLVGDNYLPAGHEAHRWPNLILTCHDIASAYWPVRPPQLSDADRIALENLQNFIAGKPLKFRMDEARYNLST
jgi:phosphoglycerate dehydrogenase-like enzyme